MFALCQLLHALQLHANEERVRTKTTEVLVAYCLLQKKCSSLLPVWTFSFQTPILHVVGRQTLPHMQLPGHRIGHSVGARSGGSGRAALGVGLLLLQQRFLPEGHTNDLLGGSDKNGEKRSF